MNMKLDSDEKIIFSTTNKMYYTSAFWPMFKGGTLSAWRRQTSIRIFLTNKRIYCESVIPFQAALSADLFSKNNLLDDPTLTRMKIFEIPVQNILYFREENIFLSVSKRIRLGYSLENKSKEICLLMTKVDRDEFIKELGKLTNLKQ